MAESLTQYLQSLADTDDKTRLKIVNYLKNAGFYSGKVTSKFNAQLISAVTKAEQEIAQLKPFLGEINRTEYYISKSKEGIAEVGAGGPRTVRQEYVSTEQSISKTLDDIAKDLLGRALTDKEKSKYAKRLIKEQRKPSSDVVSTYSGNQSQMQTTRSGLDESQFLIEQISDTDEAKANKALKGYDIMLRMLGGLR